MLVPVSGGGLISGIAAAVKALVPQARIIGVEPEDAADARESMAAGEIRTWPTERTHQTIADGLRVNRVGDLPWVHIQALVDEIVTVSDDAMRERHPRAGSAPGWSSNRPARPAWPPTSPARQDRSADRG